MRIYGKPRDAHAFRSVRFSGKSKIWIARSDGQRDVNKLDVDVAAGYQSGEWPTYVNPVHGRQRKLLALESEYKIHAIVCSGRLQVRGKLMLETVAKIRGIRILTFRRNLRETAARQQGYCL